MMGIFGVFLIDLSLLFKCFYFLGVRDVEDLGVRFIWELFLSLGCKDVFVFERY